MERRVFTFDRAFLEQSNKNTKQETKTWCTEGDLFFRAAQQLPEDKL